MQNILDEEHKIVYNYLNSKKHSSDRLIQEFITGINLGVELYIEKTDIKHIVFKTDNRHLFEFSIPEFTNYGYKINELCLDLYSEDLKDNVATEYEEKFHSKGMPIYKVDVTK